MNLATFLALGKACPLPFGRLFPGLLAMGLLSIALSGCFGGGPTPYYGSNAGVPQFPSLQPTVVALTPGAGTYQQLPSVAVLLPLSGQHSAVGRVMQQAAQMAIDESANAGVQFAIVDTQSSSAGAMAVTSNAINGGATLVLGPLLGDSLTRVAQVANQRGVAAIGFTNDVTRSRTGAWALGLAPEQSMNRMMQWASENGYRRVALVWPATAYGQAAQNAAQFAASRHGVSLTVQSSYGNDDISKNETAESVAARRDQFDAVLIPDSGSSLREVASLLYFHEVEPTEKKYMGLEGWENQDLISEQSLLNGVFAVPPSVALDNFERRFQSRYGVAPDIKAAIAYDAVKMAAELASSVANGQRQQFSGGFINPFTMNHLTRPQGFDGVLGKFRLTQSGKVERLYQIKQLTDNGMVVVSPPANGFSQLGLPAG